MQSLIFSLFSAQRNAICFLSVVYFVLVTPSLADGDQVKAIVPSCDPSATTSCNAIGVNPVDLPTIGVDTQYITIETVVTTSNGQTSSTTQQKWIGVNTQYLTDIPTTITTVNPPVTTTETIHAEMVTATTTSGGSAAVETSLLISPALADILAQAYEQAAQGCSAAKARHAVRQSCAINSEASVVEILDALLANAARPIVLNAGLAALIVTFTIKTAKNLMIHGQGLAALRTVYKYPADDSTDPPTTTSDGPVITAIVDPAYTYLSQLLVEWSATPTSTPSPTPSLFCANGGRAQVDRNKALGDAGTFCKDKANVNVTPIGGVSEQFDQGTGGSNVFWVHWSLACTNGNPGQYTINEDKCNSYFSSIIDGCDTKAGVGEKHGGNLTDGCGIFGMVPQTKETVACGQNPYGSDTIDRSSAFDAIQKYCNSDQTLDPNAAVPTGFSQSNPPGTSSDNVPEGDHKVVRMEALFRDTDADGLQCTQPKKAFSTKGDDCTRRLQTIIDNCMRYFNLHPNPSLRPFADFPLYTYFRQDR
jgi:hypothetical protein